MLRGIRETTGGSKQAACVRYKMPDVYQETLQNSKISAEYHLIKSSLHATNSSCVFFDLYSSVEFRRTYDGKQAFKLVERFRYIIEHWVRHHEGSIIKHTGDGMMAVFADFNGALACAKDVILTTTSEDDDPYPIRCKIGIAHGFVNEVTFSHGNPSGVSSPQISDYVGVPADLAARLASIGYPGQILIDEAIAKGLHNTAHKYRASSSTTVNLKGFGETSVSELLWEGRVPMGIDPQANALPVIKLNGLGDILKRAIALLNRALEHLEQNAPLSAKTDKSLLTKDYVLVYVDFPAFGSFSFPDESKEYCSQLLKVASKKRARVAVLSPDIARRSSEMQFSSADYERSLQDDEKKRRIIDYVGNGSTPDYSTFIDALLQKDRGHLDDLARELTIATQAADPRVHAWIRGNAEAVVSFVLVNRRNGESEWSETGFYTTSSEFIQILRDYITTLLDQPLGA
jgi:class 3 adenylate cyclase